MPLYLVCLERSAAARHCACFYFFHGHLLTKKLIKLSFVFDLDLLFFVKHNLYHMSGIVTADLLQIIVDTVELYFIAVIYFSLIF